MAPVMKGKKVSTSNDWSTQVQSPTNNIDAVIKLETKSRDLTTHGDDDDEVNANLEEEIDIAGINMNDKVFFSKGISPRKVKDSLDSEAILTERNFFDDQAEFFVERISSPVGKQEDSFLTFNLLRDTLSQRSSIQKINS
jgi:hypothetical protein